MEFGFLSRPVGETPRLWSLPAANQHKPKSSTVVWVTVHRHQEQHLENGIGISNQVFASSGRRDRPMSRVPYYSICSKNDKCIGYSQGLEIHYGSVPPNLPCQVRYSHQQRMLQEVRSQILDSKAKRAILNMFSRGVGYLMSCRLLLQSRSLAWQAFVDLGARM